MHTHSQTKKGSGMRLREWSRMRPYSIVKGHKKCFWMKQVHVRMKPSQKNDTTILSHYPYILCHLPTMPCVWYVHRRVVEGSGVCSAACWRAWRVSCVMGGCNLTATEHGRHGRYAKIIPTTTWPILTLVDSKKKTITSGNIWICLHGSRISALATMLFVKWLWYGW